MKKKMVLFLVLAVAVIMALCLAGCAESAESAVATQSGDRVYIIDVGSSSTSHSQDVSAFYGVILPQITRLSPIVNIASLGINNYSTDYQVVLQKPVNFYIVDGNLLVVEENNECNNSSPCQNNMVPSENSKPAIPTVTTTIVVTSTVIVK
jgi:hypothetical protein